MKRWFAVGVTMMACLLLVGCGVPQEGHDAMRDAALAQVAFLQNKLSETQSDLTEAQLDLTEAQLDLTKAENQINTLESDLTAMQGKYVQVLGETNKLKSQLHSLESQLESQLSDYDVLVEKMTKAELYAEMLEKYMLVPTFRLTPFFRLTAEERIDLDHLVHYTGNAELKEKWMFVYFGDREADKVEFFIAVGDGLWEVLR